MTISDTFTRGNIAGLISWAPTLLFNLSVKYLKISNLMYLDFSGIIVYGHKPANTLETYFALFVTISFMSFLGAVFVYLLKAVGTENYKFKGFMYGGIIWFSSYAITLLLKAPQLGNIPALTAISNLIGASIYGITLSYITVKWVLKE